MEIHGVKHVVPLCEDLPKLARRLALEGNDRVLDVVVLTDCQPNGGTLEDAIVPKDAALAQCAQLRWIAIVRAGMSAMSVMHAWAEAPAAQDGCPRLVAAVQLAGSESMQP